MESLCDSVLVLVFSFLTRVELHTVCCTNHHLLDISRNYARSIILNVGNLEETQTDLLVRALKRYGAKSVKRIKLSGFGFNTQVIDVLTRFSNLTEFRWDRQHLFGLGAQSCDLSLFNKLQNLQILRVSVPRFTKITSLHLPQAIEISLKTSIAIKMDDIDHNIEETLLCCPNLRVFNFLIPGAQDPVIKSDQLEILRLECRLPVICAPNLKQLTFKSTDFGENGIQFYAPKIHTLDMTCHPLHFSSIVNHCQNLINVKYKQYGRLWQENAIVVSNRQLESLTFLGKMQKSMTFQFPELRDVKTNFVDVHFWKFWNANCQNVEVLVFEEDIALSKDGMDYLKDIVFGKRNVHLRNVFAGTFAKRLAELRCSNRTRHAVKIHEQILMKSTDVWCI